MSQHRFTADSITAKFDRNSKGLRSSQHINLDGIKCVLPDSVLYECSYVIVYSNVRAVYYLSLTLVIRRNVVDCMTVRRQHRMT